MAEKYDKDYFYGKKKSNYSDYEKINSRKQFKSVISFIKKENLKGHFLDVGCAFGLLLKEVSPFSDNLYGCDVSRFAIGKAKQKIPNADLRVFDITKSLPYSDNMFDCITALDVLEHTSSFEKSFGNLVRKLKKGGYLILSLPIDNGFRKIFGFLDKDEDHKSLLSKSKIIEIINKHKMEIIKKKHFCPFPIIYKIPHVPAEVELILRK